MGIKLDIARLIAVTVEFSQRATTVAYEDATASRIVPQIVRVIAIVQGLQRRIGTPIKYPNAAVFSIRNVQSIRRGHIKNTLGLLELADGLYSFSHLKVHNLQGVVT